MMMKKNATILALVFCLGMFALGYPIINIGTDLVTFKIAETNISPSVDGDQTPAFQAVVDYLANAGGGIAIVPPGTYKVNVLIIRPNVEMVGSGRGKTIFRTSGSGDVIRMEGGAIRNFTVYGTPDEASSGDNWYVGTGGVGKGGTARALSSVGVRDTKDRVVVDNIEALEARYDCLYVRDCNGLAVSNSHFDRAGRNLFTLAGDTDKFLFSGCYFGNNWGLYHTDIEPNKDKWAKNGLFVDCVFDSTEAGIKRGTGSWGRMLIFSGMGDGKTRNIAVVASKFKQVAVRIRGSFPDVQFLYNHFDLKGLNTAFLQLRTNKGAELPDCRIIGNHFDGISGDKVIYNVAITGNSIVTGNTPQIKYQDTEAPKDSSWQEDHPSVLKGAGAIEIKADKDGITLVKMPLMGYEYNFATATASTGQSTNTNDIAMHGDPLMAINNAQFSRSNNFDTSDISSLEYAKQLWNVKPGEVLVVKTNTGKLVVMEILGLEKKDISFRYRFL